MEKHSQESSLDALNEIRTIMERSTRFLSLSGMSGVWAGCVALVAATIGHSWQSDSWFLKRSDNSLFNEPITGKLLLLAACTFVVALAGAAYFTWRKVNSDGQRVWNSASRQFLLQLMLPMLAGAIFCLGFIYYGHPFYLAPACLIFYGLALINAGKYTLSDIRYLGLFQVALGCVNLFMPGSALYIWGAGFGILHILYGIIMWNKYDKKKA